VHKKFQVKKMTIVLTHYLSKHLFIWPQYKTKDQHKKTKNN